ncbi:MAG: hypothetical protein ACOY35_13405 [Bacillota bacterium]
MTIIERIFHVKSQDPIPYCPRAFLQKIYNLAHRNQGFIIFQLMEERKFVVYHAETKKGKVILIMKDRGQRTSTEIVGTVESLKEELANIMSL